MVQRYRDGRLERVVERASVVALALRLSHDAVAVPVHDEGVLIYVPVVDKASCNGLNEGQGDSKSPLDRHLKDFCNLGVARGSRRFGGGNLGEK